MFIFRSCSRDILQQVKNAKLSVRALLSLNNHVLSEVVLIFFRLKTDDANVDTSIYCRLTKGSLLVYCRDATLNY